jgi:glycosyltransferase involved in cell wall biosynthesis
LSLPVPSKSATSAATTPRILILAPGGEILGGHSVQADALLSRLESDGYRVSFLPINPRFPAPLRALRRVPYLRTLLNEALYLLSFPRFVRADLLHVFSASYWSFLLAPAPAMVAARALGRRVILHYHSGEAEDHLERWSLLVHPFLRLAHQIVVPSLYLREVFERYGYRARVIPNIIDTSRFPYRERVPLRPRLLSTRNLEPYYRVDVILEAFARLRRERPDATLTIAGYGSEEERLKRHAESLGSDGIRFLGRVEPSAMPAIYDEADIFVNASVVDNQPVSVLEAFACGLPVVSTPTGDLRFMVRDGDTGIVVPPADAEGMANGLLRLLRRSDQALPMVRSARRAVEGNEWSQVREAWADVYSRSSSGTATSAGSLPLGRGKRGWAFSGGKK